MAASICAAWPRLAEFCSSAGCTGHRISKARGKFVMRPSVRIGNRCINVSKLTLAIGKRGQKVDVYRRGLRVIASAGSSDKLLPEEPSDNSENKVVPTSECNEPKVLPGEPSDFFKRGTVPDEMLNKVFDQTTLQTLRTKYGSGITNEEILFLMFLIQPQAVVNKIGNVEWTSEFIGFENASSLMPELDSSYETILKVGVNEHMSSASSSFGPLRPPDSRVMIEVINKLLRLLFNILELAITKFGKCPKQDLYNAIILTILALIGRYFYFEFYESIRLILSDSNLL